jgi:hypothetical protein
MQNIAGLTLLIPGKARSAAPEFAAESYSDGLIDPYADGSFDEQYINYRR